MRNRAATTGTLLLPIAVMVMIMVVASCSSFGADTPSTLPDGASTTEAGSSSEAQAQTDAEGGSSDDGTATSHLVGHWTFDEGAGALASDSSGNAHHLALMNGAQLVDVGHLGGSMDIKGAGVARASTLNNQAFPQNSGTIAVWFRLISAPATGTAPASIVDTWDDEGSLRKHFFIRVPNENTTVIQVGVQSPGFGASSNYAFVWTQPLQVAEWHHVAFTWTGDLATVYFDRKSVHTGTLQGVRPTEEEFAIGQAFAGNIDELRLYDVALVASEVGALP